MERYDFFWNSCRFFRDYEHRCHCGHRMWPVYEEDCFAGLPCPRCSGTVKPKSIGLWDCSLSEGEQADAN